MENGCNAAMVRCLFSDLPELDTPRMTLRRMSMRDANDIFAYASDPLVAQHVLWSAHKSVRDSRSYLRFILRQYHAAEPSSYGIVLKETGKVIGTIGFMAFSPEDSVVEVGYSLSRACWGQGLATEALNRLLHMIFRETGLHRVEARYEVTNPASRRVMEKCGMTFEGVHRGGVFNKGRFSDVGVCAILREDWEKAHRW